MATPRDIRRLALLALYQLDATNGEDPELIAESLADLDSLKEEGLVFVDSHLSFSDRDRELALATASGAWEHRESADTEMAELAPDWPVHRQASVDRAILRLAHYEMTIGDAPPKAVVNEAVELAKAFSTEKSPAFINGLLGRVLKRVLAERGEPVPEGITDDIPSPSES